MDISKGERECRRSCFEVSVAITVQSLSLTKRDLAPLYKAACKSQARIEGAGCLVSLSMVYTELQLEQLIAKLPIHGVSQTV